MKRIFRTLLLVALIATLVLSLASCGSKASNPDDVSGSTGDIKWSYTKSDRTLTISGSGEVTGFGSSEDVPWKDVRSAVEVIRFKADDGASFTKIGSYAFYGMAKLEAVSIPEGVESIGDCSFAFCSALTDITLPTTLTSVGASAFEACSALESVELPAATAVVGEGAFAFCRSLESVTLYGAVEKIEKWTFRDCVALRTLRMDASEIDAEAFLGASINADGIKSLRTSVVSVTCKDEEGSVIGGSESVAVLEVGEKKSIEAPSIAEYELVTDALEVEGTGEPITVEYIYRKVVAENDTTEATEEATDATAQTPADESDGEKGSVGAIIAIVIFLVVIAAIVVGAVLLMRSNKNTTKDSMTVRKNSNGNNNKKGKKK